MLCKFDFMVVSVCVYVYSGLWFMMMMHEIFVVDGCIWYEGMLKDLGLCEEDF